MLRREKFVLITAAMNPIYSQSVVVKVCTRPGTAESVRRAEYGSRNSTAGRIARIGDVYGRQPRVRRRT